MNRVPLFGDLIPSSSYCPAVASSILNPMTADLSPLANPNHPLHRPSPSPGPGSSRHRNPGACVFRPKCRVLPRWGGPRQQGS